MPRGGYQRPQNPAPASGPGALSRRTDGGPPMGGPEAAPPQMPAQPPVAPSREAGLRGEPPSEEFAQQAALRAEMERMAALQAEEAEARRQKSAAELIRAAYVANPSRWLRRKLEQLEAEGR